MFHCLIMPVGFLCQLLFDVIGGSCCYNSQVFLHLLSYGRCSFFSIVRSELSIDVYRSMLSVFMFSVVLAFRCLLVLIVPMFLYICLFCTVIGSIV